MSLDLCREPGERGGAGLGVTTALGMLSADVDWVSSQGVVANDGVVAVELEVVVAGSRLSYDELSWDTG